MLRNEMACVYESEVRQDFEKAHPEMPVRNRSIDECMKDEYAVNWVKIKSSYFIFCNIVIIFKLLFYWSH